MKLIKINPDHYVIVDDLEIKEGDWYIRTDTNIMFSTLKSSNPDIIKRYCKKITHSTDINNNEVYYIPLEKVKELIGEVDVESKAKECIGWYDEHDDRDVDTFIKGYTQAIEDNKDKKYTEEDMRKAISDAWIERGLLTQLKSFLGDYLEKYIQSIQPQTEWNVTFDKQGKLQLI